MDDEPSQIPPVELPATVTTRRRDGARAVDSEPVARVGDVLLGRFRLQRILGRGGMGVVFAASDLQMQGEPLIAVKLLNEDMRDFPVAAAALERECRKVRMLANDAIVRVFEFYRAGEQTFITMELLEGESLDAIIKRFPQGVPTQDAWPIIRAAADALAYAHRQKPPFVHSDFKPSNVFCTRSGQVKVLDFGVARAARASDKAATNLSIFDPAQYGALTPAYASAEMLAGLNADVRDDVYALACVAYELLSGQHPFARRPADQVRSLKLKPRTIDSLGGRINRALAHGLAVDRADRTSTPQQFLQELGDPPEPLEVRRRRSQRWRQVGAGVVAVMLLGVGLYRLRLGMHRALSRPPSSSAAQSPERVGGDKVVPLLQLLGIESDWSVAGSYPTPRVRTLLETAPRKVVLGSTPEQIQQALTLCREHSRQCQSSWYADETQRTTILQAFELDANPVSVRDFRRFVDATRYRTEAEATGVAFATVDEKTLIPVSGGNWRNAVNQPVANDDDAVVGISFRDARSYCSWRQQRLPTEDEWEYVARGPERHVFPWGDELAPATRVETTQPAASAEPAEGIGLRYRGLSGNVWQWVDTEAAQGTRVLKGGSWLATNPANRRAATRQMEKPSNADADSGFRCARSTSAWPDVDTWIARLK